MILGFSLIVVLILALFVVRSLDKVDGIEDEIDGSLIERRAAPCDLCGAESIPLNGTPLPDAIMGCRLCPPCRLAALSGLRRWIRKTPEWKKRAAARRAHP